MTTSKALLGIGIICSALTTVDAAERRTWTSRKGSTIRAELLRYGYDEGMKYMAFFFKTTDDRHQPWNDLICCSRQ